MVQISINEELLERIDEDAEARVIGRSAFIRAAVSAYLEARRRRQTDQQIVAAYGGHDEELVDEIESLMGPQAWPSK